MNDKEIQRQQHARFKENFGKADCGRWQRPWTICACGKCEQYKLSLSDAARMGVRELLTEQKLTGRRVA